jgi:DNA-binding NtrC family response regulator
MNKGAYDYLEKGCSLEEIEVRVARALENQELKQENQRLRSELQERYSFGNMVGKSRLMEEVFELIKTVAKNRSTVLISGQSGTGKELVARAIHYNSPRKNNPFIKINCAALPPDLIKANSSVTRRGLSLAR